MDVQTISQNVNKRGKLLSKVVKVTNAKNKKDGLDFETINKLYKALLRKYNPNQIRITGKRLDGDTTILRDNIKTLKANNYSGDNLKYIEDAYYDSAPHAIREKLQTHYANLYIYIDF